MMRNLNPSSFQSIFDHAPTALVMCDREGRIISANRAFSALVGSPACVPGTLVEDALHESDSAGCKDARHSALREGSSRPLDAQLRRSDEIVFCRITFAAVPGGDDTAEGIVGAFEDVSSSHAEAEGLREAGERYRLAVERANDLIFNTDRSGRFTFVNPTACLLTQYPEEELVGMHFLELVRSDGREAARAFYLNQLRRRVPSTYYEYPVVSRGGETLWLSQYTQLILDGRNRVTAVQAIARNITHRRLAEEELRTSQERLRAVVSSAPLILWATDISGRLTLYQGQALDGMDLSEDLLGQPLNQIIDDPTLDDYMSQAREGATLQVQLGIADRVFDAWFSPTRNAQGSVTGVIGVAADVTERQHLQHRLHEVEKTEAVGQLAGGIAHDFNNQLTAILGYAELVERSLDAKDPRRDDLREITKAGRRAATLTEQLLAYGRRQPRRPKVIDVNSVLRGIEPLLRRSVPENVRFRISFGHIEPIRADPVQIEQVVLNLVLNAKDALEGGGQLTLSTAVVDVDQPTATRTPGLAPGRYVAINLTDTGVGMDETTLSRVFEPFFTTKELGKGTGLGMASAYGIVRQSGGHILATSEVARGTTFTVHLPAVSEALDVESTEELPRPSLAGSETILVVEDDPTVRSLTSDILRDHGYEVLVAKHSLHALEVGASHAGKIDLLLTDIVMPGMNGRDLAKTFQHARPETRVMFMTGYAQDDPVRSAQLESNQLLEKPFAPGGLLQRVRALLDQS
jgi:PAS domain S-box-containing protein